MKYSNYCIIAEKWLYIWSVSQMCVNNESNAIVNKGACIGPQKGVVALPVSWPCWLVSLLEVMSHITKQTESKHRPRLWTLELVHVQDVTGLRCFWRRTANLIELCLCHWTGSECGLWKKKSSQQLYSVTAWLQTCTWSGIISYTRLCSKST